MRELLASSSDSKIGFIHNDGILILVCFLVDRDTFARLSIAATKASFESVRLKIGALSANTMAPDEMIIQGALFASRGADGRCGKTAWQWWCNTHVQTAFHYVQNVNLPTRLVYSVFSLQKVTGFFESRSGSTLALAYVAEKLQAAPDSLLLPVTQAIARSSA